MVKYYAIFPLLVWIIASCTPGKTNTSSQPAAFPSSDSFRTADLFSLSPDKQLLFYQNIEHVLPITTIKAGAAKYPLVESLQDFSRLQFLFGDTIRTIDAFMMKTNVVGLIVIKNDTVLYEAYRSGSQRQPLLA